MANKSYVIVVLGVALFLFSFLYAYTIFVGSAMAQSFVPFADELRIFRDGLGGAGRTGDPLGSAAQGPGTKLVNPVSFESLGALIAAILDIIVQIAVPIAALFLIYSGFLFVTAQGDETKLGTAKSIFLWTMVGVAVLLGAKILAGVIEGTINQFKG